MYQAGTSTRTRNGSPAVCLWIYSIRSDHVWHGTFCYIMQLFCLRSLWPAQYIVHCYTYAERAGVSRDTERQSEATSGSMSETWPGGQRERLKQLSRVFNSFPHSFPSPPVTRKHHPLIPLALLFHAPAVSDLNRRRALWSARLHVGQSAALMIRTAQRIIPIVTFPEFPPPFPTYCCYRASKQATGERERESPGVPKIVILILCA